MKSTRIKNIKSVSVLILFLLLLGCTSSNFNLIIQPNKLSNDGQPFYVIVKKESMFNYLDSNVDSVYDSYLNTGKKDYGVLIYPSKGKQVIPIGKSKNQGISVYFLFKRNKGEGSWKFYINPNNQEDKTVNISKNNVMEVL
ncbi:type VI secretion system lipoprotein IglE [Francisella sp. SYW-9]|uniref:type VI secretion system lipoprotein IglE n=1 Tax=Francisella sp. SYW-9 TaxID=2610888 RepID=UPI00123E3946|nr:type VI secretion system lipoprotein IglE [Francisella sp. SYW-9]